MPSSFASSGDRTLINLQAAFLGEMVTAVSYRAFAHRAQSEELHGAASLFRAAARAEQIHASNHARVIRHLGGEAMAEPRNIAVHGTVANLKAALRGELNEVDDMYPSFLRDALTLFDATAIRTFTWAIEAEKTHVRLFTEALEVAAAGPSETWLARALDFYVCTVCGYTAAEREAENCPVCNYLWDRFELVGRETLQAPPERHTPSCVPGPTAPM